MAAFTKKDMKPSLMPCCLTNRSWCRSRSASTLDMSTSLKVVRIAAACCASTSRRATVLRSGDIGTTRSRAPSAIGAGRIAGGASIGAGDGAGAGAGAWPAVALPRRASRPASRIRPPRPLPLTSSTARPLSASARRADGAARTGASAAGCPLPPPSWRPLRSNAATATATAGLGRRGRDLGPICSISAITSPTATVSPALRRILRSTPAPGEGTSTVAFSLSTSTSGSSTETSSPSACFQAPSVASRTDSPNAGTRNSIAI